MAPATSFPSVNARRATTRQICFTAVACGQKLSVFRPPRKLTSKSRGFETHGIHQAASICVRIRIRVFSDDAISSRHKIHGIRLWRATHWDGFHRWTRYRDITRRTDETGFASIDSSGGTKSSAGRISHLWRLRERWAGFSGRSHC